MFYEMFSTYMSQPRQAPQHCGGGSGGRRDEEKRGGGVGGSGALGRLHAGEGREGVKVQIHGENRRSTVIGF
jgi:hypothetical protein